MKTETKLELTNGLINKKETAILEMPQELKPLNFKPKGDYIIAEFIPVEKTPSGLFIPEAAQKDFAPKGLIIAIGPKVTESKLGDIVVINGGKQMQLDGRMVIVLRESYEQIVGLYESTNTDKQ